jgi:hypothetical protein
VHAEPSHWLHEISISKTVRHHFRPWANTRIINFGWVRGRGGRGTNGGTYLLWGVSFIFLGEFHGTFHCFDCLVVLTCCEGQSHCKDEQLVWQFQLEKSVVVVVVIIVISFTKKWIEWIVLHAWPLLHSEILYVRACIFGWDAKNCQRSEEVCLLLFWIEEVMHLIFLGSPFGWALCQKNRKPILWIVKIWRNVFFLFWWCLHVKCGPQAHYFFNF